MISNTFGISIKFFLEFPGIESDWLGYSGLLLIVIGMIIRYTALRTLGRFFTVNLSIHENHKLVDHGLYKYIRHPSYSGSLLSFLGFSLSLSNWLSMIIIFVPVFISFLCRIRVEESLLLEQFGLKYEDYIKKTKRLIPLIY